jgi:hypothetical protein
MQPSPRLQNQALRRSIYLVELKKQGFPFGMVDVADAGGENRRFQLANSDGHIEAGKLLSQAASLSKSMFESI